MQLSAVLCALLAPALAGAQYAMVKEYAGDHFFDDWAFYDHCKLRSLSHVPSSHS